MDLVIRCFNNVSNQVSSRELPSSFMGHFTVWDIMNNFLKASSEREMPKYQWMEIKLVFHRKLTFNHHHKYSTTMLFLGFCGLLDIIGELKTDHVIVKWKAPLLLSSFYNFFKESPARRADY